LIPYVIPAVHPRFCVYKASDAASSKLENIRELMEMDATQPGSCATAEQQQWPAPQPAPLQVLASKGLRLNGGSAASVLYCRLEEKLDGVASKQRESLGGGGGGSGGASKRRSELERDDEDEHQTAATAAQGKEEESESDSGDDMFRAAGKGAGAGKAKG